MSKKGNESHSIVVNNIVVTDPAVIASFYNEFFQSMFSVPSQSSIESILPPLLHSEEMPVVEVSFEGIVVLLLNIDVKKSVGPDDIPNEFLRSYAEWVAHYLKSIFDAALAEGRVPDDWLTAKVIPVHKSGDRQIIENYRPTSPTPKRAH